MTQPRERFPEACRTRQAECAAARPRLGGSEGARACGSRPEFYEQCLGGQLGAIFLYAGTPLADQVPADWQDKVMHGRVTVGGQVLMGGDVAPDRYEAPKGVSLSLQIKNRTEAERIFRELGKDGRVAVPLAKTFWAARFGMLVDRFGIPWLINCEGPDQPPEGSHSRV